MKKTLDIAFFGSSLVSSYWNGAATYYRGLLREMSVRGHRITFLEPDAYDRQRHRDIDDPEWARVIVYPEEPAESVLAVVRDAVSTDVVIKASGVGVHDEVLEEAVVDLSPPGTLVLYLDVDAPATLDRIASDDDDPFRNVLPRYDHVVTYGGGDPVVRRYMEFGARGCTPVYNAVDPSTHFPVGPVPKYTCDLAFLGNRLPDREARVDEFFFKAARLLPERRFLLGGSGWNTKALPLNVDYIGHVSTNDHNAVNSTALAVLNVNRQSMAAYGFSPPTRVFEAAGAGACLITDEWAGIEDFLEPDKEVLVARNGGEVARHLESLTRPRASALGSAARSRILREHTYARRAAQLETILFECLGARERALRCV